MDKQLLLYERVFQLRSNGLGYGRIITEIQNLFGVRLSMTCVSYWVNKRHSPLREGAPVHPNSLSRAGIRNWRQVWGRFYE